MIIEFYADQNLKELRKNVIFAFKRLKENKRCPNEKCLACDKLDKINFTKWHPEKNEEYNQTWYIIDLLEHFGHHSYDYDAVLYTFRYQFQNKVGKEDMIINGDELSFNQAVCNMFVKYARQENILPV